MKTKLSVSRCCCVGVGCSSPTCLDDTFDTYGTGNSIFSNPAYNSFESAGDWTQTASDTLASHPGSSLAQQSVLYWEWGIAGKYDAPAFTVGGSDNIQTEVEVISMADYSSSFSLGIRSRNSGTNSSIGIGVTNYGFNISKTFSYYDNTGNLQGATWDTIDARDYPGRIIPASYYNGVWQIKLYDYAQAVGNLGKSRATFDFDAIRDGVTLYTSSAGAYPRVALEADVDPIDPLYRSWCVDPRGSLRSANYESFPDPPIDVEFDNLKMSVEGDTSC